MTKDEDFKALVRARMGKTGESYTTARQRLFAENPSWTGPATGDLAERVEALESQLAELADRLDDLEDRVDEAEESGGQNPDKGRGGPYGVFLYEGETMIRCRFGCGMEARGFASKAEASEALELHYAEHQ